MNTESGDVRFELRVCAIQLRQIVELQVGQARAVDRRRPSTTLGCRRADTRGAVVQDAVGDKRCHFPARIARGAIRLVPQFEPPNPGKPRVRLSVGTTGTVSGSDLEDAVLKPRPPPWRGSWDHISAGRRVRVDVREPIET